MRRVRDGALIALAERLGPRDLEGTLAFAPGESESRIVHPRWIRAVHLFERQTRPRGRVHAMPTAAGAEPEPTDLLVLPGPA